jgi:uncharacterized alpha-E superfamily protein
MLSRVAENLYWIARYVERAENVARLLDDSFHLELDAAAFAPGDNRRAPVESVLTILACRDEFTQRHPPGDREAVLRFLTFEREHPHSILSMLACARENARGTQETLSAEAWGQINRVYLYLCSAKARRKFAASPSGFYEGIKRSCLLFNGLIDGTLPRTEIYHFLQLGRYLERVNQNCRILSVKLQGTGPGQNGDEHSHGAVYWTSLLQSCSAYESFLRQTQNEVGAEGVVGYLVLDHDFPRSMRFAVDRCCESLRAITGADPDHPGSRAERLLGRLDGELRYLDVEELFRQGLDPFLTRVQESCMRVADQIHQTYFLT